MLIEHFHNATCIVTSDEGVRILCDPWFNDGAFVGSWCLAQPVHRIPTRHDDFDLVYISHIHPDHCDERFLAELDRDVPMIVPREIVVPILVPKLESMGFTNVIALADREQATFGDLTLTMFEPFQSNPFDPAAQLPNFLDSALLVRDRHHSFLNTNDNLPTPHSIAQVEAEFGTPDVITLLYNSAGFYPQCVRNLNHAQKLAERDRVLEKALARCTELALTSRSPLVLPFAGDYALGGRLANLNEYLPVATPHVARDHLIQNGRASIALGTGGIYSVGDNSFVREGVPYTESEAALRGSSLSLTYPYETDPPVDRTSLSALVYDAAAKLRGRQTRVGVFPAYCVEFVDETGEQIATIDVSHGTAPDTVTCHLDARLLSGILRRRYHWDNAQIGCHITFDRSNHPTYSSDLHFILALLHI